MFDYADDQGRRETFGPLAEEMAIQARNVAALRSGAIADVEMRELETSSLDWAAHVMQERTGESRSA
jgi:hypothetical protein